MTILGKAIVAILLVGVVGGGAYYATNVMKDEASQAKEAQAVGVQPQKTEEVVAATDTVPVTGKTLTEKDMSFSELVKKGGSYECTVKQSVMGMTTEGKVYIKESKLSATFSTSMQGRTMQTFIIAKDGYSYTWSNMAPGSGVKTKVTTDPTTTNANAPTSGSYAFDGKSIGSYSCSVTEFPESVFDIPSTVTFKEVK